MYWLELEIDLPEARSTLEYDVESFKTSADDADVLGTSSYGTVRRCYHDLLKYVVVKCMHCGGSIDAASTSFDVARREIRFLTRLNHPHIVQTYGITSWDQCFGIIMEEVKGGDLYNLMVVEKNIEVDWKARYRIIFELADALRYLHSHNPKYVHLNVKPENVLLTLNLSVKLADFGLVEITRDAGATSTTAPSAASSKYQYTPLYTAPERLKDVFGTKAKSSMDVYSFAMVCYEVITRQAVFQDAKANVTLLTNLIASRGLKPNTQLIDNLEDEMKKENSADLEIFQHLKNVMEKCWCFKAEDRPSMKKVVQEMNKFGASKESYESDTKSEADEITEPDQTAEQVSLKHFFPPFQRVSNFDASDKSGKHTELANDFAEAQYNLEAQKSTITSVEYDASCFTTSADQADVVGAGRYGVVRRCNHSLLKNVVVKCMHRGGSIDTTSNAFAVARKEIRFLTLFKHPHIVQSYGITVWDQCFGIIMEEAEGGNLHDLMIVNKHVKIDWKLRYKIIFHLADALKYLHFDNTEKPCVHLDIKPENILLTANLSVKLADFGSLDIAIATGATSTETLLSNQYTPVYTAPERLLNGCAAKPKRSMDVYSFAMVCYEVITRHAVSPDKAESFIDYINSVMHQGRKPNKKYIDDVKQELELSNNGDFEIFLKLKSIMENCWCFTPKDRISMNQVHKRLVDFAKSVNPYESFVNTNANEIAKIVLQNQKLVVKCDKKVSLKQHFPPFECIANSTDNTGQTADNGHISLPDQKTPIIETVEYDASSFTTSAN